MPVLKFEETPYQAVKDGMNRKIIHTIRLLTGKVRLVDSFSPPREDFL